MAAITLGPPLLIFAAINIFPIAWAVLGGFHEISAFNPEWKWVGLDNYRELAQNTDFHRSLWLSVVFAGGSVILQLIAGTGFALLLNREFKFANIVRSVAMLPYLVPTAILGFVALWMGNSQWGIINQILVDLFGMHDQYISWYGNTSLAMPSVIVTNSWKFSIFVTILVLARLQSIPNGFYEAAKMAGASRYQMFRDITLPNIKNIMFIVILLRGIWMFNKFDIIWILTEGGPRGATRTAPIYVYRVGFTRGDLGMALAIATVLFTLLVLIAILYFVILQPSEGVNVE